MKSKDIIIIENIRVHTNHGCMTEEEIIGSDYLVDIEVHADMRRSAETDALEDTVDYVLLNKIVHRTMSERSKLLETVAVKILRSVEEEIPMADYCRVKISKINPPMGGNVEKVSVIFEEQYTK
ncbi:MAG: dihydroneopterin aldolase [Weeksellaceae bacterium]|nr:dihydroneopterin aldolase [Weeksellaceae bacterium]